MNYAVLPSQIPTHLILCVDDEIIATRLRGAILEQQGYSVVICHHPQEALQCDLSTVDLAIVDFEMPVLDGKELLLRMRALGARFPVVLLSGSPDALSHEDRILFARCLDKARPIERLLDTLTEFLNPGCIPDFGI